MDSFVIAGRTFRSRLIVGTGKYKSGQETARAIEASGAEMVTVAVRRVNLDRSKESLLDFIDPKKYFLLPNTAGCYTADDAIRTARLGREVGLSNWVKLEVIGDEKTLFPDNEALLEATRVLLDAMQEAGTLRRYVPLDVTEPPPDLEEVRALVAEGNVVAATDYAGLGTSGVHPYLVGDSEGRSVLDSIRSLSPASGASR